MESSKIDIVALAKLKGFESQFLSDKPYKYSNKEELRWLFWLTELQDWLRNNYGIHIDIYLQNCDPSCFNKGFERTYIFSYRIMCLKENKVYAKLMVDGFGDSHVEVLEKGLLKTLQNLDEIISKK